MILLDSIKENISPLNGQRPNKIIIQLSRTVDLKRCMTFNGIPNDFSIKINDFSNQIIRL